MNRPCHRLLPVIPPVLLPAAAWGAEADTAPKVDFGSQLVQVMGGLALVLALVVLLAWLARRLNASRIAGARNLRLVGGISLGARERIVVVEVGGCQLVVGVAPGRVQTLHVLERPLEEQAPMEEGTRGGGFSDRLARALGGEGEQ